MGDAIQKQI